MEMQKVSNMGGDLWRSLAWPSQQEESWRRTPVYRFPLDKIFTDLLDKGFSAWGGKKSLPDVDVIEHLQKNHLWTDQQKAADILVWNGEISILGDLPEGLAVHLVSQGEARSCPPMPTVSSLSFQPKQNRFLAMQKSQARALLCLYADGDFQDSVTVHHIIAADQALAWPQVEVILAKGSQLSLIETFSTLPGALVEYQGLVSSTEIYCQAGALLQYYALQHLSAQAISFHHLSALLEKEAQLDSGIAQVGARLAKWFVSIELQGEASQSRLHGFSTAKANQHLDMEAEQIHKAPRTKSELMYKNAIYDRAVTNFSGLLRMEKGAVFADANQVNKNIVLSPKAKAHTAPKLEILVDEVACSHGATVGDVDPESLFYLESRGIATEEAQRLLVQGFLEDAIALTPLEAVRSNLISVAAKRVGLQ